VSKKSKTHSIATVIHYCTNDFRFLRKVVDEAKNFSSKIIIPVCDHFFNGKKENRAMLNRTYHDFPDCEFIEFAYYPDRLYSRYLSGYSVKDREWGFFWHSTSRYIAAVMMPKDVEYILFLDSDEVIDGKRFLNWLDTYEYRSYLAMRFSAYFYLLRPDLCNKRIFTSALMTRPEILTIGNVINSNDRYGLFLALPEPKKPDIFDPHGRPFIHHYSWVRLHHECVQKSETWGHRLDVNWSTMLDQFLHHPKGVEMADLDEKFESIAPFFDPLSVKVPLGLKGNQTFKNVIRVDEPLVYRKAIERDLIG
jgi:hypothetical protein